MKKAKLREHYVLYKNPKLGWEISANMNETDALESQRRIESELGYTTKIIKGISNALEAKRNLNGVNERRDQ